MNQSRKTIWDFFISKHRFTMLIILVALLLGVISIIQIPKESDPEVDIPIMVINTPFPGSGAREVEELVTNIIEDKILGLDGVKRVNSTSREGFSNIIVEFNPEIKNQDQKDKIQEKVDEAKVDLPDEAEDSVVRKIETADEPIFIFSFSGPYDVIQLNKFAEKLKDGIEKISRVSKVEIVGGRKREAQVIVDKAALDGYGLGISQVTMAIRSANADIPTGSLETAGADYVARLVGRLLNVEDIKKIPVSSINGAPILIEDIGQVIDGYKEETSISRLSLGGNLPLSSVTINVFKSKGGNIIRLVSQVKEVIEENKSNFLPEDIKTEVLVDISSFIKEDLNNLLSSGLQTVIIILILLYIFIGGREAIIASLAAPFSFLITFIFLSNFGYTLNFLSLFSLILALGILIDTAVVVVERMNIYINIQEKSPKEAARLTVHEFQWPLIVGTLTTVFAFTPMLLMSGIMGQYMRFIPITVTIVLLSSLFVGLAIIPAIGARRLKRSADIYSRPKNFLEKISSQRIALCSKIFNNLTSKYKKTLTKLISDKKNGRKLAISVLILFSLSLSLPITGLLSVNMFPSEDADLFFIEIKESAGVQLEETSVIAEEIENYLLEDERIKSFTTSIGQPLFFGGSGEHMAEIVVNLKERKERKDKSVEIVENYQRFFDEIIEAEVSIIQLGSGPPSASPIDIGIRGDSLEKIESLTLTLKDILRDIPGTANVQTSIEEAKGEFVIQIDRAKAQLFGLSAVELAQVLRNAVSGAKATVIRNQGEEVDVIVKYGLDANNQSDKTSKATIGALKSLTIATHKGDIPLSSFTIMELGASKLAIRHEDGQRAYRLTGVNEEGVTPIEIIKSFQEKISDIEIGEDIEIVFGGEQEDLEQSYNDMFRAMILAIFLIAGILILQFGSYRQPLFILSSIPLSFIGVFPGLMLIGVPLTLPAIIGIVALAGIVVNNGIILIDMINKNRRAGFVMNKAVIEACGARLRPIILTTITTIVGILPITLSSEVWSGLGFSIIFGLTFSATLTLFVVPSLYIRFGEKKLEAID